MRWCNTQGEQCHSKMILKRDAQEAELILGSANFTARNLKNYNLETNLRVIGRRNAAVFTDAQQYFNGAWSNLDGRQMSVAMQQYADESKFEICAIPLYGMEWVIDVLIEFLHPYLHQRRGAAPIVKMRSPSF